MVGSIVTLIFLVLAILELGQEVQGDDDIPDINPLCYNQTGRMVETKSCTKILLYKYNSETNKCETLNECFVMPKTTYFRDKQKCKDCIQKEVEARESRVERCAKQWGKRKQTCPAYLEETRYQYVSKNNTCEIIKGCFMGSETTYFENIWDCHACLGVEKQSPLLKLIEKSWTKLE